MNEQPLTAQDIQREFSDITEMVERGKVKLTPEISRYLHDGMKQVLANVENGISEKDLKFIRNVKFWVKLPENIRERFNSIEEMEKDESINIFTIPEIVEANNRNITFQQWRDLVSFAKEMYHSSLSSSYEDWINSSFEFSEKNKIYYPSIFGYLSIKSLNIKKLPDNLRTAKDVAISYCNNLESIPNGFEVNGHIAICDCKNIKSIGKNVKIEESCIIENCPNLESLSSDFECGWLILKGDEINPQLIEDANKLVEKGQIGRMKID